MTIKILKTFLRDCYPILLPPSFVLRKAGAAIFFHSNSTRQHPSLEGLGVCNPSPQHILRLIGTIKQHYRVISFDEFVDRGHSRRSLAGTALVTFDDGFKSIFQDLYNPLKESGTPFIIFINSKFCNNNKLSWMQKLSLIIQNKKFAQLLDTLQMKGWAGCDMCRNLDVRSFMDVRIPFIELYDHNLFNETFDLFLLQLGISEQEVALDADLYLTQELLWEMRDVCTPGNHTHSHPNVATLSYDILDNEIIECNKFIRTIVPEGSIPFAIPYGPKHHLTSKVLKVAHKYCHPIFTAYGYSNIRSTQMQFRRFGGDNLTINSHDNIASKVTGVNFGRQYVIEWISMLMGR